MGKKRSSVSVLADMPSGSGDGSAHHSVDVRKIDNGYVVRESRCCDGEYHSSEHYSAEKPNLQARTSAPNPGKETMRGAMKELNRK